MPIDLEKTRRCALSHSGSHRLDATSSKRAYYECRGCRHLYAHTEVRAAGFTFPSIVPGVEALPARRQETYKDFAGALIDHPTANTPEVT